MSLRLRLTLLNTLILVLVGGTLVAAVYALLAQSLVRQVDDSLREQERLYSASAALLLDQRSRPARLGRLELRRFAGPSIFVQVAGRDGTVYARSNTLGEDTLPLSPEARSAAGAGRTWLQDVEIDGEPVRQLVAPLRLGGRGPPGLATPLVIQVARPLGPLRETLRTLQVTVLAVGAAGVLVALVAGWLLARAALRPIDLLARSADAIGAARDFGRRVPPAGHRSDEVGRLSAAFNRMLDELQAAHEQQATTLVAQRRFVADASHELRTPLATLRGNVDLLRHMAGAAPPADVRQAGILDDLGEEAERMSRLVADLLLLAQADAGQHLTLRPLDVAEVARDAARAARLLREGVGLDAASLPDGLWVLGHADRLRQVLLILLDNALKFTPVGGRVTLAAEPLRRGDVDGVAVSVRDTGPGIPPEQQGRIFDRFYRGATARSGEGTGLGLAIARWIVEEHRGTIRVESAPGVGALFTVWLPATPAPPAADTATGPRPAAREGVAGH